MSTYAIGDVQGCYDALLHLLEKINFDEQRDTLWFVGDLVNRGPNSLDTLRLIKNLPNKVAVLGNHDLHLLALAWGFEHDRHHNLHEVLNAEDANSLIQWVQQRPLLHYDEKRHCLLVHAGLLPQWSLSQALTYAQEVEAVLRDDRKVNDYLYAMYGDTPYQWSETLTGWERLRFITNVFTRLRYCTKDGTIDFIHKGPLGTQPQGYKPWFEWPASPRQNITIIFGHWAALEGKTHIPNIHALDTGCVWDKCLTAFCLENQKRYQVHCKNR